ncbi:MAG: response regulator transcription factor [Bryobacteraceae bacterium]
MTPVAVLNAPQSNPKVLVVDDHHLVLDALRVMMKPQFEVMAVDNCQAFVNAVEFFRPDVAILDVSMPDGDGFATAKKALERQPSLSLMFLSTYQSAEYVNRAAELGAKAYLSKRIPGQELIGAITSVLEGKTLFNTSGGASTAPPSPEAISFPAGADEAFEARESGPPLTARQCQVLTLIARGGSAKDIANRLNISVRTAEFHRAAIMQRLGLHSTAQMTRYALSHNLG